MLLKIVATILGLILSASPISSPVLPDATRTPGAINASVTQANIQSTICVSGYTETIRPSSSYTTNLKKQQLASGYAYKGDKSTADYEEDHLISLELGGNPTDPRNLWPEPYAGSTGARVKDLVENKLHDLVCSGAISLSTAQNAIASNWFSAYNQYVLGKQSPSSPTPLHSQTPTATISPSPSPSKSTDITPALTPAKKLDPRFATCKAANAAGYGPYYLGKNPEYSWYTDANHDGKVC